MRVLPMLTLCILIKACFAQKNDRLIPLTSVDIGFFSAAVTHAPVLGKHVVADVTAGIGPGYDVAEGSHVIKFLPAAFFSVTPKYYFNREKRATKGLDLKFNSGNFLGARVKYSLPLITENDEIRNTLLMNAFWGLQRRIRKSWFFGANAGIGYALDVSGPYNFGTLYPALDFRFGYVIGKKAKG